MEKTVSILQSIGDFIALGLSKIGQTVTKVDNAAIRGMIRTVSHLVTVVEA